MQLLVTVKSWAQQILLMLMRVQFVKNSLYLLAKIPCMVQTLQKRLQKKLVFSFLVLN